MADTTSNLKWVLSATDHASKVLANAGKGVDELRHKNELLRKGLEVLSVAGFAAFAKSSIDAYADANKSQTQLEDAYKKFPAIANVNIQAFQKLNDQLQSKKAVDNDALASAEATLAMFKLTGTQIKTLIPLVADLAQKNGMDLNSAATLVGKAFMGNARALKSVGIEFKSTGNQARDFGTITDLLTRQVGGAGETFRKSAAGGMKEMQLQLSDLQESIGQQLIPALTTVASVIQPVLAGFNGMPEPIKSMIIYVGLAGAAFKIFGGNLVSSVKGLKTFITTTPEVESSMGRIGKAATKAGLIVGAVSGITHAIGNFQSISINSGKSVEQLDNVIQHFLDGSLKDLPNAYEQSGRTLGSFKMALDYVKNDSGVDQFAAMVGQFLGLSSSFMQAKQSIGDYDQALANLVNNGNGDQAARFVKQLGLSAADGARIFPEYTNAIADAALAQNDLANSIDSGDAAIRRQNAALVAQADANKAAAAAAAAAAKQAEAQRKAAIAAAAAAAQAAHQQAGSNALSDLHDATSALNEQVAALRNLQTARSDEITSIDKQVTAGARLTSAFDMSKYTASVDAATAARQRQTDAEKAFAAARADVNKAKTPEELDSAIKAQAQANQELAASRRAVADADKAKAAAKLTPGNLLASLRSKLAGIKGFYSSLSQLRKRGLPMSLIRELIDAGPIDGQDIAKTLLAATPADFKAVLNTVNAIDKTGTAIGTMVGDSDYNSLINRQKGVVVAARNAANRADQVVIQNKLYIDGRELTVALKAYKQSLGGAALGLA
jgi:hypothetical protein